MEKWFNTEIFKPKNGDHIIWMDSSGEEIEGFIISNMWFPGKNKSQCTMYIYYLPKLWKYYNG